MDLKNGINRLISEESFYRAVMVLITGLPVVEFVTEILSKFSSSIISFNYVPILFSLFGIAGTMLTIIYRVTSFRRGAKLRTADIFCITLLFFMIISAVFSHDPGLYSGGDYLRCEDPFHFLAYYWLFFAGTLIDNPKYRKNLLFAFTAVAILEGVIAFFQTFNIELSTCYLYRADRAAYGLTQNSNYYGCLSVFFTACISGLYIFSETIISSKIIRCILPFIAGFVFYTMIGSRARLAWAGFIALVIFYAVSLIIMSKKDRESVRPAVRRAFILSGVFLTVFLIAFYFTDFIREAAERSYWEVVNGDVEMMGTQRLYIWKWGLKSVPDNWLTGVGLDNYQYVFFSSPDFHEGMYQQDKAHNEYIHILVTQGIPALINYLALLIYTCAGAVRKVLHEDSAERRALTWILLGAFVTYSASALFNISITYVAMYFWLVIGLIIPRSPLQHSGDKLQ